MGRLKVVVILGPTATGKSNCGILLAHKLNGEIISGDSMGGLLLIAMVMITLIVQVAMVCFVLDIDIQK